MLYICRHITNYKQYYVIILIYFKYNYIYYFKPLIKDILTLKNLNLCCLLGNLHSY